jgi:protein-disulfide isomerase
MAAKTVEPQLAALIAQGTVSFEYRHLVVHPTRGDWAAQATECAGDQGRFWDFHDLLFANQQVTFTTNQMKAWAAQIKLDTAAFNQCFDAGKYTEQVKQSTKDAAKLGFNSTPTFTLNGQQLKVNYDQVAQAVIQAVNKK